MYWCRFKSIFHRDPNNMLLPIRSNVPKQRTNVVVSSDGSILYVPPVKERIKCRLYSKEEQLYQCEFKFGSWTYSGDQLDLKLSSTNMDLSSFVRAETIEVYIWFSFIVHISGFPAFIPLQIVKNTAARHVVYYECCPESYLDLTFRLVVKKRGQNKKEL